MEININQEQCKSLQKYPKYFLSESGRLYRTDKDPFRTHGYMWHNNEIGFIKEIKCSWQVVKDHDVLMAGITLDGGKRTCINVIRTVASTYLKQPRRKAKNYHVIHIDGNIENYHYSNLKYELTRCSKLNLNDVRIIRTQIKMDIPLRKIAEDYNVTEMQINRIKSGENWGNGTRKIKIPTTPFEVKDGKLRRFLASFNQSKTLPGIRKEFYIKRDKKDPTNNLIIGITNGYKFTKKHQNITRAIQLVEKLNEYFFTNKITYEPQSKAFFGS